MTNRSKARSVWNQSSRSLCERYQTEVSFTSVEKVRQHQEIVRQH
jgi:hypothetical protein